MLYFFRPLRLALALILLLIDASEGQDGTVGLFQDLTTRVCAAEVDSGETLSFIIAVELQGRTEDGFTGASFGIRGLPSAWVAILTPNPASAVALGNPFSGSASVAFPTCQLGSAGLVKLYDVLLIATSSEVDVELEVCAAEPSPFNVPGPFVSGCDLDEWLAGTGRTFGINASPQYECSVLLGCGPLAIQRQSWTAAKLPYLR